MSKTESKPTVRSLTSDPAYAAAAETLARLRAKSKAIDDEESRLFDMMRHRPQSQAPRTAVLALLGDDITNTEVSDGAPNRLGEIHRERRDVRAAIEIAAGRVQAARYVASRAACDDIRPEYVKRVKALCTTLLAAYEAHTSVLSLSEEINDRDIARVDLPPMQASQLFGHDGSTMAHWLREAREAGYIAMDDIPEGLRV